MKEIFLELIKEACNGKVLVDDEEWPYSFNTIIEDSVFYQNENNNITLVIKDLDKLITKLEEYIDLELSINRKTMKIYNGKEKDKIKWLLSNLIANMTTEDFMNPVQFVDKYISFLKDESFAYLDSGITINLPKINDSSLEIKREQNNTSMETPNKLTFTLKKEVDGEEVSFQLPSIYYGIRKENNKRVCYIYSIMQKNNKNPTAKEIKYQKQINRLLYKLNSGIVENQEYQDYKEGKSDYYPEDNITDITHSFLFSLNVFMSILQKENIEDILVIPYLPVRYNSRYLAAKNSSHEEELMNRNNQIQTNATNKLIRTFRRLAVQNNSLEITNYPYEIDEYLRIHLKGRQQELDNMLLEETNNKINTEIKEK